MFWELLLLQQYQIFNYIHELIDVAKLLVYKC